MCYHPYNLKKQSLNTGEILSEHILEMNDRPFCATCVTAPSGTNIENIEKWLKNVGQACLFMRKNCTFATEIKKTSTEFKKLCNRKHKTCATET